MTDAAKSCVRGKPIFCSTCKVTAISFSSAGVRTVHLPTLEHAP